MEKTVTFASLHKNNTKLATSELGYVELKYISSGDFQSFSELLNSKDLEDKRFVRQILFNQLLKPQITLDEFSKVSDEDFLKIAHEFIDKEKHTFKYYRDTGNFFTDFRLALKVYQEKQLEIFAQSFKPLLADIQKSLASFNKGYADVILQALDTTSYIKESLIGVSSLAKQINQVKFDFIQPFRQFAEQYKFLGDTINKSLIPQINLWSNWAKQNSFIFQGLVNFWKDFQEKYNIAEQKAVLVLQKYKWFITPSLPATFVFTIMRIDQRKGRQDKAVNKIFVTYFSSRRWKRAEDMVASWKGIPLLKKRLKILENCVLVLKRSAGKKQNSADVVLPTLITQIDGLLSDYLTSKGISWDCDYDDIIRKAKVRVGRKSQFKTNRSKTMSTQLDDLANDIFLNILFQRSQKGKPLKTPFNFNRHKIIHGENTSYGRRDYVVRALLIVDFLAHLK